MTDQKIKEFNQHCSKLSAQEIIQQAFELKKSKQAIVTTNFSPYEAVILHLCTQVQPDIKVVWVDSGYMLEETYHFAHKAINQLNLNIDIYTPRITKAHREAIYGNITNILDNEEELQKFADEVKLEPFKRALAQIKPDLWFTALRREQSPYRKTLDYVSLEADILKVNPILDWEKSNLEKYIAENNLPNQTTYFDPSKAGEHRECGLHNRLKL